MSAWQAHARRGRAWSWALAAVASLALVGCGGGDDGPPRLTWYINPDNGGQADLAERCGQ